MAEPSPTTIDELVNQLSKCFTADVARRIIRLKASGKLQSRVNRLAEKSNAGTLTDTERAEYEPYVRFSHFVTLLQIKARNLLDSSTIADSAP
jgi:hypothetical protein